jgi:hypothetical protein
MPWQTGTLGGVPAPETSIPRAALTRYLRELPNYVVLRNEEDLFGNVERGGDIDLLVGDAELAERTLIRHLGPPIWIIRYSYSTGYFFDWGHIDLVRTIEWQGACYLPTEAILEVRRFTARGRPVLRMAHEAAICWLTSPLWGGFFKKRYAPVIRQAVETDGVVFEQALMDIAGKRWGHRLWRAAAEGCPEISGTWVQPLRRAVWWRACLRSPVRTIRRYLAFVITELRRRVAPPVPWIAIFGPDRNEKSSLANEIVHRLAVCPYTNIKTTHWSPRLMARAQDADLVTSPDERPVHGPIGSGFRVVVLAVDWLVNYWTRWVHLRAKGYMLLSDHSYLDLIVDPKRRGLTTGSRLARALWWLLPKPELIFLLDAETGVLGQGKEDLPRSERERQHACTTQIRELAGSHLLNRSLPLGELVDEVQSVVRAWMVNRSSVSLGSVQPEEGGAPTARAGRSSDAHSLLSRGGGS